MTGRTIMLTLTRIESTHLVDLVEQFAELVTESDPADAALQRLSPNAYPDDPDAAAEFSSLTRDDLLGRRARDCQVVLSDLRAIGPADLSEALSVVDIAIASASIEPWLRTLAAIRLVLASRLGIDETDDHDPDDPGYALYDWLGYRLDGLITAAEE